MRDISRVPYSEIRDRIDSWDNYHRDMVVWLYESAGTDMSLDEWAEQFALCEIGVEINRENGIWEQPTNVVDLAKYRDSVSEQF